MNKLITQRFFVILVGSLLTLLANSGHAEESDANTYSALHMKEKEGLGFGVGFGALTGITLFYDHNLSEMTQLHTQLNANGTSRTNLLGEELLKTQQSMLLATYRYFPRENSGLYLGAGGGYANSTLTYNSSTLFGGTPYQYNSQLNGVFLMGEVGWQGNDGYYFHVGFEPAGYITSNDNFDNNNIPNTSNHRTIANQEHDNLKALGQLSIGFGWFF